MTMSSSGASGAMRYFLYIPVWATTQQPEGSSSGTHESSGDSSSAASSSSESHSESSGSPSSSSSESTSGSPSGSSSGSGGTSGGTGGTSGGSSGNSSGDSSGGGSGSGGGGGGGGSGGGGGGGGSGGGGSGSNCLLCGTRVSLADGSTVPIEALLPGMEVASLVVPGLETDADYRAQYAWLTSHGLDGCVARSVRITHVKKGEHDGSFVINGRIRATFEHPFLVRRDDQWGFVSAHLLEIGDRLVVPTDNGALSEERIDSLEAIAGVVRTVAIHVPGTNMFLADGVWTHNDISLSVVSSSSGSSSSGSGSDSSSASNSSTSGKSSGSSFSGGSVSDGSILSGGSSLSGGGPPISGSNPQTSAKG